MLSLITSMVQKHLLKWRWNCCGDNWIGKRGQDGSSLGFYTLISLSCNTVTNVPQRNIHWSRLNSSDF
jgi:hypothetical protein